MGGWLREIDDLLRGTKATPELLAQGTAHLDLRTYIGMAVLLGIFYGLAMGLYAATTREPAMPAQLMSSALKVPALFFLTLAVSSPSLYVFSALLGARLTAMDALRTIVSAITVSLAVLASFAPITVLFTLSTTSYPFMKLLNVFLFAVAGIVGLKFLVNMLDRLDGAQAPELPDGADPQSPQPPAQPRLRPRRPGQDIFRAWLAVYALVGLQMAWILRPFIGSPHYEAFRWFRPRGGSVFADILRTIGEFLGG